MQVTEVDLPSLIREQHQSIQHQLKSIRDEAVNQRRVRAKQFAKQKLASILESTTYCLGKLATAEDYRDPFSMVNAEEIQRVIAGFRRAVEERLEMDEALEWHIGEIEYAINEIALFAEVRTIVYGRATFRYSPGRSVDTLMT